MGATWNSVNNTSHHNLVNANPSHRFYLDLTVSRLIILKWQRLGRGLMLKQPRTRDPSTLTECEKSLNPTRPAWLYGEFILNSKSVIDSLRFRLLQVGKSNSLSIPKMLRVERSGRKMYCTCPSEMWGKSTAGLGTDQNRTANSIICIWSAKDRGARSDNRYR